MVIELLPMLTQRPPAGAPGNDNAAPSERVRPLVRALRRRPGTTYASAGNVILPLRFAERMPGWRALSAPRR
jgi:hypothetical protein